MGKFTEAVKLVNKARRAYGRKSITRLPKGHKHASKACPLKNALNGDDVVVSVAIAGFRTLAMATAAAEAWETPYVDTSRNITFEIGKEGYDDQGLPILEAPRKKKRYEYFTDIPAGWYAVVLPDELRRFVARFDSGEYPELIEA